MLLLNNEGLRFDGFDVEGGASPSESVRISEDSHLNVIIFGIGLVVGVLSIVVHNNDNTKIFFIYSLSN